VSPPPTCRTGATRIDKFTGQEDGNRLTADYLWVSSLDATRSAIVVLVVLRNVRTGSEHAESGLQSLFSRPEASPTDGRPHLLLTRPNKVAWNRPSDVQTF